MFSLLHFPFLLHSAHFLMLGSVELIADKVQYKGASDKAGEVVVLVVVVVVGFGFYPACVTAVVVKYIG